MFSSAIVDVLLAVTFTFLAISLAASAITEAIASLLKLRQSTLQSGVQALLNDDKFNGLAKLLYAHTLVNPLANKAAPDTRPAYIESRNFAVALLDVLRGKDAASKPMDEVLSEISDDSLRQALQALWREADADVARFKIAVGSWFDSSMDRLAGWYKRKVQCISFCAALICAGLLNADPLHVTQLVWARPALADGLSAAAQSHGQVDVQASVALLDAGNLIGWGGWGHDPRATFGGVIAMVVGWAVVAGASLFGAPFWFDALQRIASIRGTGVAVGSSASGSDK